MKILFHKKVTLEEISQPPGVENAGHEDAQVD